MLEFITPPVLPLPQGEEIRQPSETSMSSYAIINQKGGA